LPTNSFFLGVDRDHRLARHLRRQHPGVDVLGRRLIGFDDVDSRSGSAAHTGLNAAGPGDRVVPGSAAGVHDGAGVGEQPREVLSDILDGVQLGRE